MRGGVEKTKRESGQLETACLPSSFRNMAKVHKVFINKNMRYRKKEKNCVERV